MNDYSGFDLFIFAGMGSIVSFMLYAFVVLALI